MFRTEASPTVAGDWQLRATCDKGHTVYKDQMHPSGPYKCPHCGADVK